MSMAEQARRGPRAYETGGVGVRSLETLEETARYNAWICSLISPHLGAKNLELGAGVGTLTALLAREHHIVPVEVSQANLEVLRQRFRGHERVAPPLADYFAYTEPASLDCIYSSNVLEHIEDDLAVIRHAARVLRPGGHFVAFVPAGMWLYCPFDASIGHCRRYTAADKRRILQMLAHERIGLELTEYRFVNPLGALGWFLNMRCRRRANLSRRHAMLMDRLIPWLSALDKLALPFGQSALMVLRSRSS
jgi:SAM-dependent methyltransferase